MLINCVAESSVCNWNRATSTEPNGIAGQRARKLAGKQLTVLSLSESRHWGGLTDAQHGIHVVQQSYMTLLQVCNMCTASKYEPAKLGLIEFALKSEGWREGDEVVWK